MHNHHHFIKQSQQKQKINKLTHLVADYCNPLRFGLFHLLESISAKET